jgi:hypothetical protein
VLRGVLSDDDTTALASEAQRAVRDATGDRYLVDDGQAALRALHSRDRRMYTG